MRAILGQQRVAKALMILNFFAKLKDKPNEILDMNELAYGSIIMHLSDNKIKQVKATKTLGALWVTLDALFLTKTLPNKIYLLEKLF